MQAPVALSGRLLQSKYVWFRDKNAFLKAGHGDAHLWT